MLLTRLLQRLVRVGELTVIDAGCRAHRFGGGKPAVTIRLHDRRLHGKLFFQPELATAEAYMDGTLTIENGSLYDFLELIGQNYEMAGPRSLDGPVFPIKRLIQRLCQFNSPKTARRNAAHHYDLSLGLYDLFLDPDRQYSCAYFMSDQDSLEAAQRQKLRRIAAKLLLEPEMRVLDIGCGWGGLGLHLAEHFAVHVVGITLSEEQLKTAREQANSVFLGDRARFFLRDYREERGAYDRIVSVGMFEHVGVNQYDAYFKVVRDRLTDDGVALLHTIGRMDAPSLPNPWIHKYIFPGIYLPSFSEIAPAIERSGLFVTDVEVLRMHYAETLRHWRERFLANRDQAKAVYDERFCRMWEFYLAGCEVSFRYMKLCVFQIQLAKRLASVPLTRDYMLEAERGYAAEEQTGGQLHSQTMIPSNHYRLRPITSGLA
jgi:cyclopropane-fatty-acyl-phospholipid synthase